MTYAGKLTYTPIAYYKESSPKQSGIFNSICAPMNARGEAIVSKTKEEAISQESPIPLLTFGYDPGSPLISQPLPNSR